ncbi:MAG TPA: Ig-like domain-containing protein [Gemmatimonadaceae bacterium]|nr:Ig-like domain-containing protein [Gemmatimonadaceae bacterium]
MTVTAPQTVLGLQESEALTASVRDSAGASVLGSVVTWSSRDGTIARVSTTGVVTPVSEGQVTISASAGARAGTAALQIVWAAADVDFSRPQSVKSMSGLVLGFNAPNTQTPGDQVITPLGLKYWRANPMQVPIARAQALGARYNVILSDYWGYPVNNWPNGRPWINNTAYATMMQQLATTLKGQPDFWEIWNEPDQDYGPNFWDGTEQQFFGTYLQTYRILVQVLGPNALIAGPSITNYDEPFLDRFAAFCIANGCQANALSWHENSATVPIQSIVQKL